MRNGNSGPIAAAVAAALMCAAVPAIAEPAPAMQTGAAGAAASQPPVQIAPLAEEHLRAAIDALDGVDASTLKGEAAGRFAAVQKDFGQMRMALSRPSPQGGDWKASYSAVERDLTRLIGAINSGSDTADVSPGAMAGIDSVTAGGLELFRSSLELFYAAMTGEPTPSGAPSAAAPSAQSPGTAAPAAAQAAQTPPQPPSGGAPANAGAQPQSPFDANGAGALLDRIDAVVSAALGREPSSGADKAVGTTSTIPSVDRKNSAGRVSIDRAALDEILAEVQQLKVMLRVRQ